MKGFRHVTHPANDVSTSEIPLSEWQVKQNLLWKICKYLKTLFTSHFARTWGRKKNQLNFAHCAHTSELRRAFLFSSRPPSLFIYDLVREIYRRTRELNPLPVRKVTGHKRVREEFIGLASCEDLLREMLCHQVSPFSPSLVWLSNSSTRCGEAHPFIMGCPFLMNCFYSIDWYSVYRLNPFRVIIDLLFLFCFLSTRQLNYFV